MWSKTSAPSGTAVMMNSWSLCTNSNDGKSSDRLGAISPVLRHHQPGTLAAPDGVRPEEPLRAKRLALNHGASHSGSCVPIGLPELRRRSGLDSRGSGTVTDATVRTSISELESSSQASLGHRMSALRGGSFRNH